MPGGRCGQQGLESGRGWAGRWEAQFCHLTIRTPVFSSLRTKMTVAWQGCEGQRDTLWCLAPVGTVSALKELVLVIMFTGEALATPGHPGRKAGLQVTYVWDKPQLLLPQPWYNHAACPAATAVLSTQDPGTCFQGGHLERQLSPQELRAIR